MAYFRINQAGVYYYTRARNGVTGRHVESEGNEALRLAKAKCPRDSGTLESRLSADFRATAKGFSVTVGVNNDGPEPFRRKERYPRPSSGKLLRMIHDGSGPISASEDLLFFIPKGTRRMVIRESTSGYEANPFVYEACRDAWPYRVNKR